MQRQRILVADDDDGIHELLSALLGGDYDLVGAVGNGKDLVDGVCRQKPDLIIVDVHMPFMNGFDAVKQIQMNGGGPKVVFFSTNAGHAYVRKALALGAVGYVLKQAASEDLLFAIREALNGRNFISQRIGYVVT